MTITLSLNVFFLICNWMKHSLTAMSVPPPASKIILLHLINSGLFLNLLKNHFDITLIDTPVSYSALTSVLLTLILYIIVCLTLPHL